MWCVVQQSFTVQCAHVPVYFIWIALPEVFHCLCQIILAVYYVSFLSFGKPSPFTYFHCTPRSDSLDLALSERVDTPCLPPLALLRTMQAPLSQRLLHLAGPASQFGPAKHWAAHAFKCCGLGIPIVYTNKRYYYLFGIYSTPFALCIFLPKKGYN